MPHHLVLSASGRESTGFGFQNADRAREPLEALICPTSGTHTLPYPGEISFKPSVSQHDSCRNQLVYCAVFIGREQFSHGLDSLRVLSDFILRS